MSLFDRRFGCGALEDGADAERELFRLEWLGQVIVGAELQSLDPFGWLAARGEQDDGRVGFLLAHALEQGEAIFAGHHHVEDDEIERHGRHQLAGGGGVFRGGDVVAFAREVAFQEVAQAVVVVDGEDVAAVRVHDSPRVRVRSDRHAAGAGDGVGAGREEGLAQGVAATLGRFAGEGHAGGGEGDEAAAAVGRVGLARHEAATFELVEIAGKRLLGSAEAGAEIAHIHGAEVEHFLQHVHFGGRNAGGGAGGFGQFGEAAGGGPDEGGPLVQVLIAQVQPAIAAGSGERRARLARKGVG